MKINSPHWDHELGVCVKHMLPSVPCPACLADEGDPELYALVEEIDLDVVFFESLEGGSGIRLRDLLPENLAVNIELF